MALELTHASWPNTSWQTLLTLQNNQVVKLPAIMSDAFVICKTSLGFSSDSSAEDS